MTLPASVLPELDWVHTPRRVHTTLGSVSSRRSLMIWGVYSATMLSHWHDESRSISYHNTTHSTYTHAPTHTPTHIAQTLMHQTHTCMHTHAYTQHTCTYTYRYTHSCTHNTHAPTHTDTHLCIQIHTLKLHKLLRKMSVTWELGCTLYPELPVPQPMKQGICGNDFPYNFHHTNIVCSHIPPWHSQPRWSPIPSSHIHTRHTEKHCSLSAVCGKEMCTVVMVTA